jgi:hypothetical protein
MGEFLRSEDDERLSPGESIGDTSELDPFRLGCSRVTCRVGDFREFFSPICFALFTRCNDFGGLLETRRG